MKEEIKYIMPGHVTLVFTSERIIYAFKSPFSSPKDVLGTFLGPLGNEIMTASAQRDFAAKLKQLSVWEILEADEKNYYVPYSNILGVEVKKLGGKVQVTLKLDLEKESRRGDITLWFGKMKPEEVLDLLHFLFFPSQIEIKYNGAIIAKIPTTVEKLKKCLEQVIDPSTGQKITKTKLIKEFSFQDGVVQIVIDMAREHQYAPDLEQYSSMIEDDIKKKLPYFWDVRKVIVRFIGREEPTADNSNG